MQTRNILLLIILLASVVQAQNVQRKNRLLLLDSLTLKVENKTYPAIHAIIISHKGYKVHEKYFAPYTRDSLHDTRSSFKSVTSILTGIAIDQGFIKNLDQKVYDFFPEYSGFKYWNSEKAQMTLKNLLEMKAGFDCEEFNNTKDCEEDMSQSDDWIKFSLDLPLSHRPGTYWSYNSSAPMILSGVITNASKMTVIDFADCYLFQPLGITHYRWTKDPAQHGMTAGSFFIRPADMLKIGQMVANQGIWQGKRIVSAQWINESTKPQTQIADFSFVGISRTKVAQPQPAFYGYYWYRERIVTNSFNYDVLFASGNGGQYIMIVDELDLVVVFTGGNYNNWKSKLPFEALARYIIPSFQKQ